MAAGDEEADKPTVTIYPAPAEIANGASVVICPGGAYVMLAMDHEGHQVAAWLNSIGVTAFVLKYRLAPRYRHPAPLMDAQPTFLMHTSRDTGVPAENSILFYMALHRAGVPAEMHVFEPGRHGFGLAPQDPILSTWKDRCRDWLWNRGLLLK